MKNTSYSNVAKGILLFVGLFSSVVGLANEVKKEADTCLSAREYITVTQYLRSQKASFGIEEKQIKALAEAVSQGCTGAAKRFIMTIDLLRQVEVSTTDAVEMAIELSGKSDQHAKTFKNIFKASFLEKYLDLDLTTSLRFARRLAIDYKGEVKNVERDFRQLVSFCLNQRKIGLSLPRCGELAQRVIILGENWEASMARAFEKQFEFLKDKVGLAIDEATHLAEEILAESPYAGANFEEAYSFASNGAGLDLPAREALKFAMQMAKRTIKQTDSKN